VFAGAKWELGNDECSMDSLKGDAQGITIYREDT